MSNKNRNTLNSLTEENLVKYITISEISEILGMFENKSGVAAITAVLCGSMEVSACFHMQNNVLYCLMAGLFSSAVSDPLINQSAQKAIIYSQTLLRPACCGFSPIRLRFICEKLFKAKPEPCYFTYIQAVMTYINHLLVVY